MIKEELLSLADAYRQAGDAIYDTIRDSIRRAGGFLPCIKNERSRQDMFVQVYDSRKKYSESFPIRAMKLDARGELLVYIRTAGTSTPNATCAVPSPRSTGPRSRAPTSSSTRPSSPSPPPSTNTSEPA